MAYSDRVRASYAKELDEIRSAGLFKEERFICSPQAAEIEVEYPSEHPTRGDQPLLQQLPRLSSHPEVIRAAHEGLDRRGYGMSSVRFICAPRTSTASSSSG